MAFLEILLIAVGLSTDAFSVALGNGMSMPSGGAAGESGGGVRGGGGSESGGGPAGGAAGAADSGARRALAVAAAFGGFQALMPLAGYFAGRTFTGYIEDYDHVVALALLAFIGGRMIAEGVRAMRASATAASATGNAPAGDAATGSAAAGRRGRNLTAASLFMQAVATSIDALIVGVGFAAVGLPPRELAAAVILIGATTFALSFTGVWAGKRFGALLGSRAEIVGGLILIAIGVKIFIEDMYF
jgi:putative Mn2+ efflux pump MntP